MMDLRTIYEPERHRFDYALAEAGLETEEGLTTAVLLSLFSDARAQDSDALPAGEDTQGWWADTYLLPAGGHLGSRLWLLRREKRTPATLLRARGYASEALAWLIEDGLARRVEVYAEAVGEATLGLDIAIYRPAGEVDRLRIQHDWSE